MKLTEFYSFFSDVSSEKHFGTFYQAHCIKDVGNDIKDVDAIIIGIPDDENGKVFESANRIRQQLFQFSSLSKKFNLIDLGNLKTDRRLSKTFDNFKAVLDRFHTTECKVVIIGGSSIYNKPVISSFISNQIPLNLICVDSHITWEHFPIDTLAIDTDKTVDQIQSNFINIGYQSYYVEKEIHEYIIKNNYETHRLGTIRSKISEFEPVLRDANVINFNLNAVKFSDAPGVKLASPNGLTGDEFCQLAFYAGFSTHLKFFGIFDLLPSNDIHNVTSELAAQTLWYLFEGMANQITEDPELTPDHFTKYHIHLDSANQNISFYQSALTKRWWMEIELNQNNRKIILSSSEKDYELACKQEIPDRWWRLFNRIK